MSVATVSRVSQRAGISRWREREPQSPACRYERGASGGMLHLDAKKLGRNGEPGHRVTGKRMFRTRGIG